MSLRSGFFELIGYKVRTIGLMETLRVGTLDLADKTHHRLGKRNPDRSLSARSIQIECTTRCNLKCTMCEIAYWTEKGGDLRFDSLERMVEHLPGLRRVDLTGVGESLMNRDFLRGVELLKSKGIYITLNDNFTLMTERTARKIVDLGLDQILLSLDGATKVTYESIRVGANFEMVLANARGLTRIKRELGKRKPEFKINTVVSLTNYKELTGIVELARDLGVGMVSMVNIITFGDTAGLGTESSAKSGKPTIRRWLAGANWGFSSRSSSSTSCLSNSAISPGRGTSSPTTVTCTPAATRPRPGIVRLRTGAPSATSWSGLSRTSGGARATRRSAGR
jgi:organic radical activating enzyme